MIERDVVVLEAVDRSDDECRVAEVQTERKAALEPRQRRRDGHDVASVRVPRSAVALLVCATVGTSAKLGPDEVDGPHKDFGLPYGVVSHLADLLLGHVVVPGAVEKGVATRTERQYVAKIVKEAVGVLISPLVDGLVPARRQPEPFCFPFHQ
ncbi:hypothetical protein O1M63_04750 [Streptomyces mirabilis]|nr:hypothetical protein [Streptomyces mirabilis]